MNTRIVLAGLAVPLFASVALAASVAPSTAIDPLPAGPGHDTTVKVCSGCHAPGIIAAQQHDRAGWHEIVETMASRGAMASDAELSEIEVYLAAHFAPSSAKAPPAPPATSPS